MRPNRVATLAPLGLLLLACATAQAGVWVGFGIPYPRPYRRVYVVPAPIIVRPGPVVVQPAAIYMQPAPVYVQPVVAQPAGYAQPVAVLPAAQPAPAPPPPVPVQ
jgi:hypothetical protein